MITSNAKLRINLPKLCDTESCTGCLACYNVCSHDAICLDVDEEGFTRPTINTDKCVGCKKCEKACPVLGDKHKHKIPDEAYAAWSVNKNIVCRSSSGGLYSVIADYVFRHNGVVFGAAFDKDWNLRHIATFGEKDFSRTRGSKYVASFIGTTYREVHTYLSQGKMVLFSGTPCQISGLKSFLSLVKCETEKLYTIDLVCHGVPSPVIFKAYLEYLSVQFKSPLKEYNYRDKRWSWKRYNSVASFKNHKKHYGKWEEDYFMRGFLREYFLRPSCHQCAFATEQRCGDFTLCDYWGYRRNAGEKDNKDRGISLVLPNTQKAKELFSHIKDNLVYYQRVPSEAMKGNPAFHRCFPASNIREDFWRDFREKGFEGVIDKYLYPEEIQAQFKRVYKYGRNGVIAIDYYHQIKNKLKSFARTTKKKLLHA